jgi:hypothetical protein
MSNIDKQRQFSQKFNAMQPKISPFKLQINFSNKALYPSWEIQLIQLHPMMENKLNFSNWKLRFQHS